MLTCQVIQSGNRSWGRCAIEKVTFCRYLRSLFFRGIRFSSSLFFLIDFKEPVDLFINLSYEFTHIFKGIEVNIKSLHQVDPFFRYQVMQNSILIYGQPFDYHNFKTYAFRAYVDSKDLLRLENILAQKTLQYLGKSHA